MSRKSADTLANGLLSRFYIDTAAATGLVTCVMSASRLSLIRRSLILLVFICSVAVPAFQAAAESADETVADTPPASSSLSPESSVISGEAAGSFRLWGEERQPSQSELRSGHRFDRGWFLLGSLAGGFWRGHYLTPGSVGGYLTPDGFRGERPPEVDIVYSANVAGGRFITPYWSLEINFAAAVGLKRQKGRVAFGISDPPGSGDRVSSISAYHLRNRFYLYDFDAERRFFAIFGAGWTQFNDSYYLPHTSTTEAKSTIFAPSISSGAGLTLLHTENSLVYVEGNHYHTFSTKNLDSSQVYTFGIGLSFPLDSRIYTEADVGEVAFSRPGQPAQAAWLDAGPLSPVLPGMHRQRILSTEDLRLIAYQNATGPGIPRDALMPPVRSGLDFTVDTIVISGVIMGFKRALNVTSARGLLRGGYERWPDNVSQVPPWNDGNQFYTNWILHPYAGAVYYMYYRDRGYSRLASSLGSFLVSAVHEYLIESIYEPPSGIDIILTPGLGVPLGIIMDDTSVQWARSDSGLKRTAAYFLNPMLGMPFARFRRGPYYDPSADNPWTLKWNWNW